MIETPQTFEFVIEGVPVAWKAHAGYGRKSFNPLYKEREYYRWRLKKQYDGEIIKSPVTVSYLYCFPIPKSSSKKKREDFLNDRIAMTKRPDLDNLDKFLSDCLIDCVIADDSLIYLKTSSKKYGKNPCTLILITTNGK